MPTLQICSYITTMQHVKLFFSNSLIISFAIIIILLLSVYCFRLHIGFNSGFQVGQSLHQGHKNLTRPTTLHLFFPVLANTTTANCSVNKPTEVTFLKFPSRAMSLDLRRTFFYNPTWFSVFAVLFHPGNQKKHLPLYVDRYVSPTLLITVYRLYRRSEQLGHLALCPVHSLAESFKFFNFHGKSQNFLSKALRNNAQH